MRTLAALTVCVVVMTGSALAQSVGFIAGTTRYDALPDLARGDRILSAVGPLEDSGMEIFQLTNPSGSELTELFAAFEEGSADADRLFVALSGRFLRTPTETYYIPNGAEFTSITALHETAFPLSAVMAVLSQKPESAILMLITQGKTPSFGPLITEGPWSLDIPEGVTVLIGSPRSASKLVTRHIAQPGQPFVGVARQLRMYVDGYAPDTLVFTPGLTPPPRTAQDRLADIRDWRAARSENTAEAYQKYLDDHPQGEFVEMAQNRVRALNDTPQARAERAEQALDLNRNARREIQRDLSLLGYNTRGIDGIFGRGTRTAISQWQESEGFEVTGYVSRDQIDLLNEQALVRAEELEAEAEARRQERIAADIEYWNQTGANGDEPGLRAYLQRFPDGEFAELANERLFLIEERKRARANRIDRQLWDEAKARNTAAAYENYLVDSPDGAFREEAQARIVALQRQEQFPDAARTEAAMNLSQGTRRIIEARLNGLGLRPGPVDGVFDEETRRAIRRYQTARKLPPSGYVSDPMMVQLMADTVRQIFR